MTNQESHDVYMELIGEMLPGLPVIEIERPGMFAPIYTGDPMLEEGYAIRIATDGDYFLLIETLEAWKILKPCLINKDTTFDEVTLKEKELERQQIALGTLKEHRDWWEYSEYRRLENKFKSS